MSNHDVRGYECDLLDLRRTFRSCDKLAESPDSRKLKIFSLSFFFNRLAVLLIINLCEQSNFMVYLKDGLEGCNQCDCSAI